MVSKEPNHLPSANSCSNHNPDKTLTVRSVLLNRDSPDIEIRLKRRRNRTQQVRFKDLDDGGQAGGGRRRSTVEQGSPHPNRKSSSYSGQQEQAGQPSTGQEVTANGASVVGAVRGDMAGTIGEVAAILARAPPHPLTPGPLRRAWAQSRPCSLTLPNPRRPCMSTAIQTSPSLQKPLPFSIARNRSHSLGDFGGPEGQENRENGTVDEVYPQNHIQPAVAAQDGSGPFRSPSNSLPGHPKPDGPQVFLPAPCPLAGNPGPCTAQLYSKPEMLGKESCSCPSMTTVTGSTWQPCATTPHSRRQPLSQAKSNPGKTVPACPGAPKASALGTSPPKDIIPCALPPHTVHSPQELPVCAVPSKTILPSPVPRQTMLPCISLSKAASNAQDSRRGGERERRDSPLPPPPPPPPPYTPRREGPPPRQNCLPPYTEPLARTGSEREKGGQGLIVPSEGKHAQPLVAVTPYVPQTQAPESSPAGSGQNSPRLRWPQSGAQHVIICTEQQANNPSKKANNLSIPGKGPPSGPCVSPLVRTKEAPLTPEQAKTLKHVQELLGGLVSGARGKLELAKAKEKLLGPQGPLHDIGSLHSQLQSLEGVLETSQNTIKVLLDVIQDLEKKEAERDGRHSYRTGQDIENCGTCRDCACIIYSVEHDFRLQEGQFTRTWRINEHPDSDQGSPQTGPHQPPLPCREDSPLPARSSHVAKKSRRKCFWFL